MLLWPMRISAKWLIAVVFTITGCVSERDQQLAEINFLSQQQQRCVAYGYKDQTPEMAQCMERGSLARQQAQFADAQMTQATIAAMNQPRPQLPGYQVVQRTHQQPVHCISFANGLAVNTTCQ
jgi:hypothetical protein